MSANQDTLSRRDWVLTAVEQFEARLTRYALRLLGDEHAARDVVQYAFLRLCDSSSDEISDRVGPWLYTVCRNRSLDLLRKNGRVESFGEAAAEQVMARETGPAESAEQQDLGRWVYCLLKELTASQHEVLELWLHGFSYREISRITSKTEGHVRVLAHRGLSQLREHPRTQALLDADRSSGAADSASTAGPDSTTRTSSTATTTAKARFHPS